ncbi:MAG TPA: 2-oxoacid:acceptor oxidoreductase family protein [Verrucomicrobiae bacterium]|jgi:2-oxoisovalerate ferredoxin oxidoreductase beta subunit|nr:2-oxoacid:acceptor oxidoreductase family protein [Verrucomicrobiae bacterium]
MAEHDVITEKPKVTIDQINQYEIVHEKSELFYPQFDRKSDLKHQTHYCPGCGHGVAHKLIAEALAELGVQNDTILVSPVGCSVFAYYYFDVGNVQVAHGRAPAAATGLKRACPDKIVIAYQGDGDLAAIGTAEIIHAANRGEKITVFFVNNAIYGMTGGQMAPTTLVGQRSTTSPWGRRPINEGFPLHMAELLSSLEAPVYIERVALSDNKNIMKARRAVRKALELQKSGAGFTFVEILSPCPTIWGKDPVEARKWVAEKMIPQFPLNVFRDKKIEIPNNNVPPHKTVEEIVSGERKAAAEAMVSGRQHHFREMGIKIAGFGGQGVLLLGQLLAEMGMREGLEVSWLPSYGPEMRSGSAHCHVCLSKERIGSPLLSHPDVLIAMNEISLRKFASQVLPGGTIIYGMDRLPNDIEIPEAQVVCIPAAAIADKLGSAKVANVVMMGALLEETECLSPATAMSVLEAKVKNPALLELDRKALDAGRVYIDHTVAVGAVTQADGFAQ